MSITIPRGDGKQLFRILEVSIDGLGVKVEDDFGLIFAAARNHRTTDGLIVLEKGDIISALSSAPGDLRDVFVERPSPESRERPDYDSVGPAPQAEGWTPGGKATGDGFVKR